MHAQETEEKFAGKKNKCYKGSFSMATLSCSNCSKQQDQQQQQQEQQQEQQQLLLLLELP